MESQIKGTVIISQNAKPLTTDDIVKCIFGKSLNAFVNEIRENKGGKYDRLYERGE
jgi:hypothetical protein